MLAVVCPDSQAVPIMKFPSLCLALAVTLLASATAPAQTVIFDNLSNGNNGFRGVTPTSWDAQRFNTDATNLFLVGATLNLNSGGGSGTFFLKLYSDNAGQPGSAIATLYDGASLGSGAIVFNFSQLVTASTNYWLVLGLDAGSTISLGWGVTSTLTGSGAGFQTNAGLTTNSGTNWQTFTNAPYQVKITANTVPEPQTVACFALGLAIVLAAKVRSLRRNRA